MSPQKIKEMIECRYQIQLAGVDLLEVLERRLDRDDERVALLLVGACFSLWRSAFLLTAERESGKIVSDAKGFLKILLEDNAVNFYTEQKREDWTVGYYLNNAMYRVNEASEIYGKPANLVQSEPKRPSRDIWIETFGTLMVLMGDLTKKLGSK